MAKSFFLTPYSLLAIPYSFLLQPNLDDVDGGDGAVAEGLEVDLQAVGVKADGDVELKTGGDRLADAGNMAGLEGDDAGRVVDGVVGAGRLRSAGDGEQDSAGDG